VPVFCGSGVRTDSSHPVAAIHRVLANGSIQGETAEALNRIMTVSTHKSLVTPNQPNPLDMSSRFETARWLHT